MRDGLARARSTGLEIVTDRNENFTAIGDGLALAVERLRDAEAKSRVAIVLTDGRRWPSLTHVTIAKLTRSGSATVASASGHPTRPGCSTG